MPARCNGFTYLGLLIALAIIAIASTATLQLGIIMQRRVAEDELLKIGAEFQNALLQYAKATPAGLNSAPKSLQSLLRDPRYPNTQRYLRKLYIDPLTGKEEWGSIASPDGKGIIGVFSLSEDKPIKIANFDAQFQSLEGKTSYREWVFRAALQSVVSPTQVKKR